jgi:hypothetical protein
MRLRYIILGTRKYPLVQTGGTKGQVVAVTTDGARFMEVCLSRRRYQGLPLVKVRRSRAVERWRKRQRVLEN